jgi:glycosyltransferase involved in cell wall biosynthesis
MELTILMPCLNESETLEACIGKALRFIRRSEVDAEILIADNGSSDGSVQIAEASGARVIHVEARGYGSALLAGIKAARGRYVIMGDADDSYDFSELELFLQELRSGAELVVGNRFAGGIRPGAMPFLHRYLGNPVLSWLGRLMFRSPVRDFHCGLRGMNRQAVLDLELRTTGMEFASEMIVKATLFGLHIVEVPTILAPDGRTRRPHLRTWHDGWRHMRFMLLYSPRWLFLIPGLILVALGAAGMAVLLPGPVRVGGFTLDIHTLLYAAMAIILGFQSIAFAQFTRAFAVSEGLVPTEPITRGTTSILKLEYGILVGGFLFLCGVVLSIIAFLQWNSTGFGRLNPSETFRVAIPAVLLLVIGLQTIFSSFFMSILTLTRNHEGR